KTAISLHDAQRGRIELVGALEVLRGILLLTGDVEDQSLMQLLEDRVPIGARKLVDGVGRLFCLRRVCHRPGRQQRRGQVRAGPADRLRQLTARERVLLLLDRAHPENEPRDAVILVDLQNAFGELDSLLDFSVGKHRQEGAPKQLVVAGVAAQRSAVIGRRRRRVALTARVSSGEIAAGGGRAGKGGTPVPPPSAKPGWASYGGG